MFSLDSRTLPHTASWNMLSCTGNGSNASYKNVLILLQIRNWVGERHSYYVYVMAVKGYSLVSWGTQRSMKCANLDHAYLLVWLHVVQTCWIWSVNDEDGLSDIKLLYSDAVRLQERSGWVNKVNLFTVLCFLMMCSLIEMTHCNLHDINCFWFKLLLWFGRFDWRLFLDTHCCKPKE